MRARAQTTATLLIAIFMISIFTVAIPVSAVDIIVNPGGSIQAAIDGASPGETIIVAAGTYTEAIWIDKSLTLLSESGAVSTIIDGTGIVQVRGAHVMISASDVVFGREGEGFTVKGGNNYNLLLTRELGLAETPTYENILIEGNILEGPCRPFASSGGAYTANLIGVTVSKNTMTPSQYGAYIDIGTDWRLIDNTLNGAWFTLTGISAGIVSGNTFVGAGVSLALSSDFVINYNSFSGETWDGAYIHVWPPCDPGTFDATLNWWGTTDPEEIEARIIDVTGVTVSYSPWLAYPPGMEPIQVEIDIKPGNDQNSINLKSKGVVPVAILTTNDFDASAVDPTTVEFAGVEPIRWTMCDVDGDLDLDMLFHFKTEDLDIDADSIEAMLTGATLDETPIEGTDSVKIVGK